ncbi:hypothetical protein EKO27_g6211 [Xylaria grammica]|uniref:Uncharacterized protein n=1 Tax=Xylaria grammica TaxID=363999 RepID=A0A439D3B0_9PEZI|nr:hypothetical protein EKO27_g6211 [Xylaria grammica]
MQMSGTEIPVEEALVEETPAKETSAQEKSAEEKPAGETPAGETPVEEKSAQEKSAFLAMLPVELIREGDILHDAARKSFEDEEVTPGHIKPEALAAHMFSSLSVRKPTQPCHDKQKSVWSILYYWYSNQLGTGDVYSETLWMADCTFLYATMAPFVQDYSIKSEMCRRNQMLYNEAPPWAHASLLRYASVPAEATSRVEATPRPAMDKAFMRFQMFCEMYNAVEQRQDLRTFERTHQQGVPPTQGTLRLQTLLHDYCRTLPLHLLEEFRSVLCRFRTVPIPVIGPGEVAQMQMRKTFAPLSGLVDRWADRGPVPFEIQLQLRGEAWIFRLQDEIRHRAPLAKAL